MAKLFDISELEADIFSEDELQAINDYARIANQSEELGSDPETDTGELPVQEEWNEGEEFPALELELAFEDGKTLKCQVVSVFLEGEKEYMALHPVDDEDGLVHIMILEQGEHDEICLLAIEDEAELDRAALAFHRFMDDSKLEHEEEIALEDEDAEQTDASDEEGRLANE